MPLQIGTPMPSFEGATDWLGGEEFTGGGGCPTLVQFWAVSCPVCKMNVPRLLEFVQTYKESGLRLVSVHMPRMEADTDIAKVRDAIAEMNLAGPCAIDNAHAIGDRFQTGGVWPCYFFFDAQGRLRSRAAGALGLKMAENSLRRLLTEEPATEKELVPAFTLPAAYAGERAAAPVRTVSLSDFAGQWLLLCWYPRDFSFVCSTELVALSDRLNEFADLDCAIVGTSTDLVYAHRAWLSVPREQNGVVDLAFPLLADAAHETSRAYGLLHEADDGVPLPARPSSFGAFGSSYYYRTVLALDGHTLSGLVGREKNAPYAEHGPEAVNVLMDGDGAWHGGAGYDAERFNTLLADGHAQNLTHSAFRRAWNL